MKKVLNVKELRKMDKGEAAYYVTNSLQGIRNFYFRFCIADIAKRNELFNVMADYKLFAKHIKKCLKADENPFPDGFNFIISELITSKTEMDEETREIYTTILSKLIKKSSKESIEVKDNELQILKKQIEDLENRFNVFKTTSTIKQSNVRF